MVDICKICDREFKDERSFHKHFRSHGLTIASYYQKFHPRLDKYTNEPIVFKEKKQYFTSDFNSRANLRDWIKAKSTEEVYNYCLAAFAARKLHKNLTYTPTQFELRTSLLPSINFIQSKEIDYFKLCESLGFEKRFEFGYISKLDLIVTDNIIYYDTREQRPLNLKNKERKTLKYADYALSNEGISGKVRIERKSLKDFLGTMTGNNLERFKKELKRSVEDGAYIVILVESSFNDFMSFQFNPFVGGRTKVTPEFIAHNARDVLQEFPNTQICFSKGRKHAAELTSKILHNGPLFRELDIQLLIDTKVI